MEKKSDFNFWNIVTVVGLILLGINYINKKDSSKKVRNKVDAPTFKYPRTPSLDLNTSKLELSDSSKIKVKGRFPNLKIEMPRMKSPIEMLRMKSPNARELSDLLRNGHPVDSNRLFLKRIEPNISPNKLKNKDDSNSNNSIESFRDVNQKNKNIVDDIKNNKDND